MVQASAQKLFRAEPRMGTLKPGATQEATGVAALTPLHKIAIRKSKTTPLRPQPPYIEESGLPLTTHTPLMKGVEVHPLN